MNVSTIKGLRVLSEDDPQLFCVVFSLFLQTLETLDDISRSKIDGDVFQAKCDAPFILSAINHLVPMGKNDIGDDNLLFLRRLAAGMTEEKSFRASFFTGRSAKAALAMFALLSLHASPTARATFVADNGLVVGNGVVETGDSASSIAEFARFLGQEGSDLIDSHIDWGDNQLGSIIDQKNKELRDKDELLGKRDVELEHFKNKHAVLRKDFGTILNFIKTNGAAELPIGLDSDEAREMVSILKDQFDRQFVDAKSNAEKIESLTADASKCWSERDKYLDQVNDYVERVGRSDARLTRCVAAGQTLLNISSAVTNLVDAYPRKEKRDIARLRPDIERSTDPTILATFNERVSRFNEFEKASNGIISILRNVYKQMEEAIHG